MRSRDSKDPASQILQQTFYSQPFACSLEGFAFWWNLNVGYIPSDALMHPQSYSCPNNTPIPSSHCPPDYQRPSRTQSYSLPELLNSLQNRKRNETMELVRLSRSDWFTTAIATPVAKRDAHSVKWAWKRENISHPCKVGTKQLRRNV